MNKRRKSCESRILQTRMPGLRALLVVLGAVGIGGPRTQAVTMAESSDSTRWSYDPSAKFFPANPIPASGGVVSMGWTLSNYTGRYQPHEALSSGNVPAAILDDSLPPSLQGKISYDAVKGHLLFEGAMTVAEKTALRGLSGNMNYRAAIDALFGSSQDDQKFAKKNYIDNTGYFLVVRLNPAKGDLFSPALPSWISLSDPLLDTRHLSPPSPTDDDNYVGPGEASPWFTLQVHENFSIFERTWTGNFLTAYVLEKSKANADAFYNDPVLSYSFIVRQLGQPGFAPEGGSTFVLLSLGVLALAVIRRRLAGGDLPRRPVGH